MTDEPNGNRRRSDDSERLVVVRVEDAVEPKLTARPGASYASPPQTRAQAMTLVRLLLGCIGEPDEDERWTAPIAGGRRVVTLADDRGGEGRNDRAGCDDQRADRGGTARRIQP
jgi:hypothetical protein